MGNLDAQHKSKNTLRPVRQMREQHQTDCSMEGVLTTIENIPMKFFGTGCFYATSLRTEVSLVERSSKPF